VPAVLREGITSGARIRELRSSETARERGMTDDIAAARA
jgi:hypothetical protein